MALIIASLRSILSRNSISSAGQGDELNVGRSKIGFGGDEIGIGGDEIGIRGNEGNIVETSSGKGKRARDVLSVSLSGICIYIYIYM